MSLRFEPTFTLGPAAYCDQRGYVRCEDCATDRTMPFWSVGDIATADDTEPVCETCNTPLRDARRLILPAVATVEYVTCKVF